MPANCAVCTYYHSVGTDSVKRESDLSGAGIEPTHELMTCTRIRHASYWLRILHCLWLLSWTRTELITDEGTADITSTRVAEILFERLSEMYLQAVRPYRAWGWTDYASLHTLSIREESCL
ncbi:hypothetical protein PIB30_077579 [Stylosanthes scabra]|uniref:Uncharacterized protein n=1 Tax=Stylosanthes scabra TaxID=79078 RepID=A0ABU6XQA6_9FABA|nr:hypothetical protein [Stylosanthes scabra]